MAIDAGEPFGVIMVEVEMSGNYPVRPPTMTIISKVHHPNVYKDGRVCMRFQTTYCPTRMLQTNQTKISSQYLLSALDEEAAPGVAPTLIWSPAWSVARLMM